LNPSGLNCGTYYILRTTYYVLRTTYDVFQTMYYVLAYRNTGYHRIPPHRKLTKTIGLEDIIGLEAKKIRRRNMCLEDGYDDEAAVEHDRIHLYRILMIFRR
jgi:hypothetical protein